jgi:hypothetical protein
MAGLMPAKATNRIVDDSWVDVERLVVAGTRKIVAYRQFALPVAVTNF